MLSIKVEEDLIDKNKDGLIRKSISLKNHSMNTENLFSSMSMADKREKLMALLAKRVKNQSKLDNKKDINGSSKRKRLNGHTYKKLFKISGQKAKVDRVAGVDASNGEKIVKKSGSASKSKRRRVVLGLESVTQFAYEPCRASSMDGKCKFNTTKFEEFWVPVHLSQIQIKKYCSILHSNSEALSSCLRNNSSLPDILTLTRKCCDHPYLVDPTLRNSSKGDISSDPLNAEINASGKLQLLDKILSEIKRCGLRVVVLFQSLVGSEKISIGDILDDLVHRRFGQESYVRIEGKILCNSARAKKKQALNLFNILENGRFVCLLDYRSCHSSIQLSRVDVAILFNNDWNVLNDIKALHKIGIDSHYERLRIFRLYSLFTIEEKTLVLAKQGTILDANMDNINWTTCHQLLAWGASYLFSKLESDHDSKESFFDDLIRELSSVLLTTDASNCSVILNAKKHNGAYDKNIVLFGETDECMKENSLIEEYLMENGAMLWANLLKESSDKHKHLHSSSRLSRRVQKSSRNTCYTFEGLQSESENNMDNFDKVVKEATTFCFVKTKPRSKRNVHAKAKQTTLTGVFRRCEQSFDNVNRNCASDGVSVPRAPGKDEGELHTESHLGNLANQFNHSLTHHVEEIPPSTHISDSFASNPRNTNNIPECPNNQPPQTPLTTSPVVQSSSAAPLELEIQRIQKNRENSTKLHQEKKLILDSECEKEILEIRKKYDALIEESDMCLMKEMKVLEEYYKLVYANNLLAKTLALTYYDSETVTSSVRTLQMPVGNPYSTNHLSGPSLGLCAPAPHIRSRPSFQSFYNLPSLLQPIPNPSFVDPSLTTPLTTLSTPHTLPSGSNNWIYQQVNLQDPTLLHLSLLWPRPPMGFDHFPETGWPSSSFLGSNSLNYMTS